MFLLPVGVGSTCQSKRGEGSTVQPVAWSITASDISDNETDDKVITWTITRTGPAMTAGETLDVTFGDTVEESDFTNTLAVDLLAAANATTGVSFAVDGSVNRFTFATNFAGTLNVSRTIVTDELTEGQEIAVLGIGNPSRGVVAVASVEVTVADTSVTPIPNPAPTSVVVTWRTNFAAGQVPEDTSVGTVLADLSATPGDTFTFDLTTNEDSKLAIVDSTLTLAAALDFETETLHDFVVRATNSGGNASTATLQVTVTDVTEGSPANSVNDYIPSTNLPNVPFQVPYVDFDIGRTNVPTATLASDFVTANPTLASITYPYLRINARGTYSDIDFRGYLVRVAADTLEDSSSVVFDQCLFGYISGDTTLNASVSGPGNPALLAGNLNIGAEARRDFSVWNSTMYGIPSVTANIGVFIQNRKGSVDCYRVLQRDGLGADFITYGGGDIYECAMVGGAWSPGTHLDFVGYRAGGASGSTTDLSVDDSVVYRCYDQHYLTPEVLATNTGVTATDALCASFHKLDKAFGMVKNALTEENVIHGSPHGPGATPRQANCTYYFAQAHGSSSPGYYTRRINNYTAGYTVSASAPTTETTNATQTVFHQGNYNYETGLATANVRVGSTTVGNVTGISLSSDAAGSITYNFTTPTNAQFVEFRYRIVGQSRWSRWTTTTSGSTLTGLDAGETYEFQFRGWRSTDTEGYQGPTSGKVSISAAGGGGGGSGGATQDTTPDAFSFTDVSNATLSTLYTSNTITVTGINSATPISLTGNGQYQKNSDAWTTVAGTVVVNDTVKARHTSSSAEGTARATTITIGGISDTYTTTTAVSEDADATSFITRAQTAASITFSAAERARYNTLIIGLKADSLWTKLDGLYLMKNVPAALVYPLNVRANTHTLAVAGTGSASWASATGVDFSNNATYFNVGTYIGLQDNAHYGLYLGSYTWVSGRNLISSSATSVVLKTPATTNTGNISGRVHATQEFSATGGYFTDLTGLTVLNRSVSTGWEFSNGTNAETITRVSAAPSGNVRIGAAAVSHDSVPYWGFTCGTALTGTDITNLENRLATFFASA